MTDFGGGCAAAEPYALRVIGDSMVPEFQDGHVIIVDPGMPAVSGAYVVVDYNGETTFRQFIVEGARKYLRPLNEDFPIIDLTGKYTIRGVVVQRAGRRRKDRKHYA
jgi:SOS-response transcriptional repressor LexA